MSATTKATLQLHELIQHVEDRRQRGSLDFESIPGIPFPAAVTPSAGISNSHDKSAPLSVLAGGRVLVCGNSCLSSDIIVVSRKHTSRIDLSASVDKALDAFFDAIRGFNEMYEKLNNWTLRKSKAQSLLVDAARAGAFSSSEILQVLEEYENPRHEVFRPHSAWSLYNAITEIAGKKQSPTRQIEGLKALNSVLVSQLN